MFIDNPRDNSKNHAIDKFKADKNEIISVVQIFDAKKQLHEEKQQINATVDEKIAHFSIDKIKLKLHFASQKDQPLTLTVIDGAKCE